MHIKEAAKRLGISARAIRFYEEKGLIAPGKELSSGYRSFTEQEIWRLRTIVALRESGMSVSGIQAALEQVERGEHDELLHYLELQRSVLYARMLETRQTLQTTDHMIGLLQGSRGLPLEDFYRLAQDSREVRELRNWEDRWNFDELASSHDERVWSGDSAYPGYREALERTVEEINPAPGETGLDLGTGTGNLAGLFMERGAIMNGVDQSKEMLRICRSKFPGMTAKIGNFLAVPYTDGQFDFVVTSFAFHHLSGRQQKLALNEMARVLKPQGRIAIAGFINRNADGGAPADKHRTDSPAGVLDFLDWFGPNGFESKCLKLSPELYLAAARRGFT
ncbi:methyltransferase domain-containing protein [Paenibacillus chitinolyticus]|uniref:methyltransferase domain-containing protein n=1 Tax=Paenibacillus chitinolyticus TaxID=79263 RepID=UPI003CFCFB6B